MLLKADITGLLLASIAIDLIPFKLLRIFSLGSIAPLMLLSLIAEICPEKLPDAFSPIKLPLASIAIGPLRLVF
jgi:hypothetical protein